MNKAEHKKANELMCTFAQCKQNKADLMATIKNAMDAYDKNMKEAEEQLLKIGEENKADFIDGNLQFEDGYLHIANNTVVVMGRKFNLADFMEQKADLVKWELKKGEIKKAFLDKDHRKELIALGVQMDSEETMQVLLNKK